MSGPAPFLRLLGRTPRLSRAHGLELAARRRLAGAWAGRHRTALIGSSLDPAEHRDYQPGDDLARIDWKAYARSDRLTVRRFHDERQLPLCVLLDDSASMAYGTPTKAEVAQLLAAMLALLALDQGDAVRVAPGGEAAGWTPWLGGPSGAVAACTRLVAVAQRPRYDPAAALALAATRLERRCLIVLISDLLDPPEALADSAAQAAARGHEVACWRVLDRSELDLPAAWGDCLLSDPEQDTEPVPCSAAQAKAGYDRAFAAHAGELHRRLAGARADLALLRCGDDPGHALAGWLAARRLR
jgi:uncharacterized protein (DUF58 family)